MFGWKKQLSPEALEKQSLLEKLESLKQQARQCYKAEIAKKEQNAVLWNQGYMVYSRESEKLYDSMENYLLSTEHYLNKEYHKAEFQRSLSTEHQQNLVRVTSNSIHYCCTYCIGVYHVSAGGCLDGWNLYPYALIDSRGSLPKEFVEKRKKKDGIYPGLWTVPGCYFFLH